ITTVSPASIYIIFPFYSAVSSSGFEEVVTGTTTDVTGRIGAFGNFSFALILIVLASIRLTQILHPKNFLRLVCLIAGFVAALFSGFRSAVINAIIGFFTAGIRDMKYAAIALLPIFAAILLALSFVNSQIFHLPRQIQRGLAFFPGNWDADMARDAQASNDFRKRVWTTWAKEYFPEQPWLGRGFGFKSQWAKVSVYKYNPNWDRQAVETGNIHNGLFATLDTFGIIGTIFFVIWNLRLLVRAVRLPFGKSDPEHMALRFLALYLAVWITCYWFGALNVGTFLPIEFTLAGVFLRLKEAMASEDLGPEAAATDKLERGAREELATA
ncbi:MAG TPA: O-antigen ligase family protein, partial [Chthoniobacterales bacterium]|nr:O-antigen ligase family protein [Chthoniobacterales bacterium]